MIYLAFITTTLYLQLDLKITKLAFVAKGAGPEQKSVRQTLSVNNNTSYRGGLSPENIIESPPTLGLIKDWVSSRDDTIRDLKSQLATVKSSCCCSPITCDDDSLLSPASVDANGQDSPQLDILANVLSLTEETVADVLADGSCPLSISPSKNEMACLRRRQIALEKRIGVIVSFLRKTSAQASAVRGQATPVPEPIPEAEDRHESVKDTSSSADVSESCDESRSLPHISEGDEQQPVMDVLSSALEDKMNQIEQYVKDAMESFIQCIEERQSRYESNAALHTQHQLNLFQENQISKEEKAAVFKLVESFNGQVLTFKAQLVRLQRIEPTLVDVQSKVRTIFERLQYCERALQDVITANSSLRYELKRERRESLMRSVEVNKAVQIGKGEKLVVHIPSLARGGPKSVSPLSRGESDVGANRCYPDSYTLPLATKDRRLAPHSPR